MKQRQRTDAYAKFNSYLDEAKAPSGGGAYKLTKQIGQEQDTAILSANGLAKTMAESQQIQTQRQGLVSDQVPRPAPDTTMHQYKPLTAKAIRPSNDASVGTGTHRVEMIDSQKLMPLLTDPRFFVSRLGTPAKFLLKFETDWCKPCRVLEPKVEALSMNPRYADILFFRINAEHLDRATGEMFKDIAAVPVTVGFVGGQRVGTVVGGSIDEIQALCDKMASQQ